MEFLTKNFLDTTTMLNVSSNTLLAQNLLSFDKTRQYISNGDASDLTTTSIQVTFGETTAISRICLLAMNFKEFKLFYDGMTANTFNLDASADTANSSFLNNTETSMILKTAVTQVTSITIEAKSTQLANSEKALGYFLCSNVLLDFERLPSFRGFKPLIESVEIEHTLSDGGTRVAKKSEKHRASIKLENIEPSFRKELKTIHSVKDSFFFVSFPTMTGWDEFGFPCVWVGDFGFYTFADNNPGAGYDGTIALEETPE